MTKIFNMLFMILKVLLLILTFALTLFILLNMYANLGKPLFGKDSWEFIRVLIPYLLLLIMFVINVVTKQKGVNDSIFYNVTCVMVFMSIAYIIYRTMTDQNMILWHKTSYPINFDFFADQIFQIKAMLYGLFVIDVLLIIQNKFFKKKELYVLD